MNFAFSNRNQQIGVAALIAGIGFLAFGISPHLVLFALLISVWASTRFAWSQIRIHRHGRLKSLFAATLVPMIVSSTAIAIVLWHFQDLVRGH